MVPFGLLLLLTAADASHPHAAPVFVPSTPVLVPHHGAPAWNGFLERSDSVGRFRRFRRPASGRAPDAAWLRHVRDSTGREPIPNWVGTLHDGSSETLFPDQWSLSNTGQSWAGVAGTKGCDVGAIDAWKLSTGDSGMVVAFLDGGIDIRHPDLRGKLARNKAELQGVAGKDDDGNGYVDDTLGWDFVRDDAVARDLGGHGTSTASLVAGAWDGNGLAGLAPDVRILPVRVADGGSRVELGNLVNGIDFAIARGAKIINLSLGGLPSATQIDSAIVRAVRSGAVVVASAGNSGTDLDVSPKYPAALRIPGMVVVGASDQSDARSGYSDWSDNVVDLSAPGDALLAATLPRADTIWSETFESALSGWKVYGISATTIWGIESKGGHSWLSDSPDKLYPASGNSWARTPLLNAGRRSALVLGMILRGTVESSDYLRIETSPDSNFASNVKTVFEYGNFQFLDTTDLRVEVAQDSIPFYVRFSLVSQRPSSTSDSGVMIDRLALFARDVEQPAVGTYARVWGTSFSAPLATGALALLAAKHPEASPESLVSALVAGAKKVAALDGASRSGSRLWIPGAFDRLQTTTAVARPSGSETVSRIPGGLRIGASGAWTAEWRDLRGARLGTGSGNGPGEIRFGARGPLVWTVRSTNGSRSGMALDP